MCFVINNNGKSLLGLHACQNLKLIHRNDVHEIVSQNCNYKEMVQNFEEVFTGIGCLKKNII